MGGARRYQAAPFTLQRLCELLERPELYKSTHKLMHALLKMVSVCTTQPRAAGQRQPAAGQGACLL